MILYIDTTQQDFVTVALSNKDKLIKVKKFKARYRQSEKLLVEIDKLLKTALLNNSVSQNLTGSVKEVRGVIVVKGPGPFTATRIGVATANALGYALGVPVIGIRKSDTGSRMSDFRLKQRKFGKKKKFSIIEPFYGKEPNITISHKP